jgi:hypothetical protein
MSLVGFIIITGVDFAASFHEMTRAIGGKTYRLYAYIAPPGQFVIEPTFSQYSSAASHANAIIRSPYQWGNRNVFGTNASFFSRVAVS